MKTGMLFLATAISASFFASVYETVNSLMMTMIEYAGIFPGERLDEKNAKRN